MCGGQEHVWLLPSRKAVSVMGVTPRQLIPKPPISGDGLSEHRLCTNRGRRGHFLMARYASVWCWCWTGPSDVVTSSPPPLSLLLSLSPLCLSCLSSFLCLPLAVCLSFGAFVSLYFSVCLSVSLSVLSHSISVSASVCLSVCLCLSVRLSFSLSVLSHSVSLSVSLSLSVCLSACVCLSARLSLSSLSLYFYACISLSVCLCLFVHLYVSLSILSHFIFLSVCLSLSSLILFFCLPLCFSFCLFVCLSVCLSRFQFSLILFFCLSVCLFLPPSHWSHYVKRRATSRLRQADEKWFNCRLGNDLTFLSASVYWSRTSVRRQHRFKTQAACQAGKRAHWKRESHRQTFRKTMPSLTDRHT